MTKQEFETLTCKGIVLLDGATGSNLMNAGMPRGVSTEQWIIEHKEILIELQRNYIGAGSQIVYAPTFAANRINLETFGLEKKVRELNRQLVMISQEAVEGKAYIAGDITTSGQMLEPRGDMTYERLFQAYQEQVAALAEAGVDLIVAETMLGVEETVVALDAALSVCDLPVMCTLSLESDGTALYGGDAVEAVITLQEMGASAVGINCSTGPDRLVSVVANMKNAAKVPIIAKPNAGMPVITESGEVFYDMSSVDFAKHMKNLIKTGAGIVGGCCGTTPDYIRELSAI